MDIQSIYITQVLSAVVAVKSFKEDAVVSKLTEWELNDQFGGIDKVASTILPDIAAGRVADFDDNFELVNEGQRMAIQANIVAIETGIIKALLPNFGPVVFGDIPRELREDVFAVEITQDGGEPDEPEDLLDVQDMVSLLSAMIGDLHSDEPEEAGREMNAILDDLKNTGTTDRNYTYECDEHGSHSVNVKIAIATKPNTHLN